MKTSEETTVATPPPPKYRYSTVLPKTVTLKAEDLTAFLPEGAWIGNHCDRQRELAVPAASILETNYPRIRFSKLSELLPGCIKAIEDAPEWVALPADRVALAYRPKTHREALPEPVEPSPEKPVSEAPAKKSVPEPAPAPKDEKEEPPVPSWKRLPKPVLAPAPEAAPATEAKVEPPKPPVTFAERLVPATASPRPVDLFEKDTELTIQRLLERCHTLPGIKACLLKSGNDQVKTGEIPAVFETAGLVSETFSALRKISEATGVKLKQAVTLQTESGAVSLLRHKGLSLVVVHSDHGMGAEARAKLKAMLQAVESALASANPVAPVANA